MPMMYASVAFALQENHDFLASTNRGYRKIAKKAKQRASNKQDAREINFAVGQAARKIHVYGQKYRMPESLKEEISFMRKILMDNDFHLGTPLGHIVPCDFDGNKPRIRVSDRAEVGVLTYHFCGIWCTQKK